MLTCARAKTTMKAPRHFRKGASRSSQEHYDGKTGSRRACHKEAKSFVVALGYGVLKFGFKGSSSFKPFNRESLSPSNPHRLKR